MEKKRVKIYGATLIAVALIALSTANTLAYDTNQQPLGKIKTSDIFGDIKPTTTLLNGGNIQLSNDPLDDQHPTIESAPDGSILVAYDRQLTPLQGHIYFMSSTDKGNTWSEIFNTDTGDMATGLQSWPGLITPTGSNIMYGVWNDEGVNYQYVMGIINPADATTWEIGSLDQSGQDFDRSGYDMAAIDAATWGWCFVGHVQFGGYDLPSAIEAEFGLGTWDVATFGWTGDQYYPITTNPDIAATSTNFWLVWEFTDETHPKSSIGIHWGNPNDETDIALWPVSTIEGDYNYVDPTIGASGNNICIVYMNDASIYGDTDLACRFSADGGTTWQDGTLPSLPQVDEKYPEVFVSGTTVFCVFHRNGNLYMTKSTNLGQNWEEPIKVNDNEGSVVAEPSSAKVSSAGVVWVDTRNGNKDIYYASLPTPIINVAITGGFGLKATISNDGAVAAENMAWSIDLSGLVFLGKHTEGTIASLEPGATTTVGPGLIMGLGPTTITVNVGGTVKTAEGMVLGPFILGL